MLIPTRAECTFREKRTTFISYFTLVWQVAFTHKAHCAVFNGERYLRKVIYTILGQNKWNIVLYSTEPAIFHLDVNSSNRNTTERLVLSACTKNSSTHILPGLISSASNKSNNLYQSKKLNSLDNNLRKQRNANKKKLEVNVPQIFLPISVSTFARPMESSNANEI